MNKINLEVGSWVKVRGKGQAEVVDLTSHQYYVRVRFVRTNQEDLVSTDMLSAGTAPKPTREEKYQASVAQIRRSRAAYRMAGWIATHESNLHVSSPTKSLERVKNELDAHGAEYSDSTLTTGGMDLAQGPSFTVVTSNPGIGNQLFEETSVHSAIYHDNSDKVTISAKQFVLDFLLDELKFKLGKVQDLEAIVARIPAPFVDDFLAGTMKSVDDVPGVCYTV